jgi:SpoVK/Ycf46/Vps4 family AAA+-type ATPase
VNTLKDLVLIIKSHFPLVVVETNEERRMLRVIEKACNLEQWPCFTWTVADGIRRVGRSDAIAQTSELQQALRHIDKTPQNGVYVLLDAHPWLDNPVCLRLVKEIAQEYHRTARTLVFVSPALDLPQDLQRLSARFSLPLPDRERIREMVLEEARHCQIGGRNELRGQVEALDALIEHLTGMCEDDAQRLIRQAIRDDCTITFDDVHRALKFKREALGGSGLLDCEIDTGSFADVGGLASLKRWLEVRRAVFTGSRNERGLDIPKGVLLLGVQGGGKSLAAKSIAGSWNVPLMRLDFGVLYNKFQGESERNLRQALKQAEAMAPCVLWIDEIEKGLAADDSGATDGGLSRRILGTLLTWMAERRSRVFLVATANDVSRLAPELLRKGRFDEIFFVDLPDAATRCEILGIHLAKREIDPAVLDLEGVAAATDGFSGAEIEQLVVAALYETHAQLKALATEDLLTEARRTRPLSVVMGERVQALREWALERAVSAN